MSKQAESRLWLALVISSTIMLVEFVGGLVSRSLALLSDSGHVLTDVFGVGLSILTIRLARMPHTSKRTFGYHRAEIFAALVNGSALVIVALVILYEAFRRVFQPAAVQGTLVSLIALVGLFGNLTSARLLARSWRTSLNVKGVYLHAVGDIISSTGVILSGVIVTLTGFSSADPIIAGLIGILILRNAFGLVRESADILMEATPKHLELEAVARMIQNIDGVRGVHDLHVWTITSGLYALSGHVTVASDTIGEGSRIIERIGERLRDSFGIEHVTLQLEREALQKLHDVDPEKRDPV